MVVLNAINKDHLKGAAVGVGVCAVGYYIYKKNQTKVDGFLKKQGGSAVRRLAQGACRGGGFSV